MPSHALRDVQPIYLGGIYADQVAEAATDVEKLPTVIEAVLTEPLMCRVAGGRSERVDLRWVAPESGAPS